MNYPSGVKTTTTAKVKKTNYTNRGMTLEEDINITNEYYLNKNLAIIHKKPTPVQIVNVHYPKRSAAVITEAYFKQASTTDYNGLYRNKYIDFEAKETNNTTSFPYSNIHEHQISHMQQILDHGGIAFFIIKFTKADETYLLDSNLLIPFWYKQFKDGRKSMTYKYIVENGHLIPFKYTARIDYLPIVDEIYFWMEAFKKWQMKHREQHVEKINQKNQF